MQYRLRTLLILLAVGPPIIAAVWFDWSTVTMLALLALCAAQICGFIRINTPPSPTGIYVRRILRAINRAFYRK